MLIDHLRKVMDQLATLPDAEQEAYATQLEVDLRERERIAAQLANPAETDLDALLEDARHEITTGQVFDLDEIL